MGPQNVLLEQFRPAAWAVWAPAPRALGPFAAGSGEHNPAAAFWVKDATTTLTALSMKLFLSLLAAGLCSFGVATAQTTPTQTAPGTGSAAPSAVPSGTAPVPSNPDGAVSAGEVFTKGSTSSRDAQEKRAAKKQSKMANGKGKTKTKM